MRLLNIDTFTFTSFPSSAVPSYVIASHRWIPGTEVSLQDVQGKKDVVGKAGYRKILGFVNYVKAQIPLVKWLWIDTCCIDQKSSQEVGEAINSMFRWYRRAEVCLAYLEDVTTADDIARFKRSIWFLRGWTLQELLAPKTVIFLSRDWRVIGHKGYSGQCRSGIAVQTGPLLDGLVAEITKIPEDVLRNYKHGRHLPVEEKMKWMAKRETTRSEDLSYCLLGILDVSMNIRYGDGKDKTRTRLMEKVRKIGAQQLSTPSDKYRIPFSLKGVPLTDHFVPREKDMQHLAAFFITVPATSAQRQRVFVVYGMGGVGKTQLCAEFARAYQEHFSAIFWLDGSSRDGLRRAMVEAALRLPGDDQVSPTEGSSETPTEASQLSQKFLPWLSLPDNKNWLLIIDNVDRDWLSGSSDSQAYDYHDFLPSIDHGNVIVTTRLQRLRRPQASLGLGSVDEELARELVESRAGKRVQDIETLLSKLGGLPLALVQAGAYLGATGIPTAQYVSSYDNTWAELMRYQNQFPLQQNTERSVLAAWKMSYEQVKSVDRQAAKLLDLWAFLSRDDVWLELVLPRQDGSSQTRTAADEVFPDVSMFSLQHSIGVLTQYSMVSTGKDNGSHTIHPVLHAWCLDNVTTSTTAPLMVAAALELVAAMAGAVFRRNNWKTGLRLAAHAKAVGRRVEVLTGSEAVGADCHSIADFLAEWEASDEVEKLYLQALREDEHAVQEDEQPSALGTINNLSTLNSLGVLYTNQGKMEKAEQILTQTLRGRERELGPEHTFTLATLSNLGNLYADQKRMNEAEQMYVRAIRGKEKTLGHEDISTLLTVNNLGTLYVDQDRLAEAEQMFIRALRGKEKALGPDHPSTLDTAYNLGGLYTDQGRMDEAKHMLIRAIEGYERVRGLNHISVADGVYRLGILYHGQGKMEEAEQMYVQALRGYRNSPHPPRDHISALEDRLSSVHRNKESSRSPQHRQNKVSSSSVPQHHPTSADNDPGTGKTRQRGSWKKTLGFRKK